MTFETEGTPASTGDSPAAAESSAPAPSRVPAAEATPSEVIQAVEQTGIITEGRTRADIRTLNISTKAK